MTDIGTAITNLLTDIQRQSQMTHAGVVIASTAILDNLLEHALKRAMIPLSTEFYGRLFGSFRPLQSFSSKIVMARALGIITKEVYEELEKIRQLRNAFAHSPDLLHFESKEIAPLFAALKRGDAATGRPAVVFLKYAKVVEQAIDSYLERTGERTEGA
jgi:DNA-binding MltR family transcriptional regulator